MTEHELQILLESAKKKYADTPELDKVKQAIMHLAAAKVLLHNAFHGFQLADQVSMAPRQQKGFYNAVSEIYRESTKLEQQAYFLAKHHSTLHNALGHLGMTHDI